LIEPKRGVAWGATRMVLLTRRWAIKLPRPTEWRLFLHGLLANMQERMFWTMRDDRMCPVHFSLPGGWLVVMPFARPLTDEEWAAFDADKFCVGNEDDAMVPAENKRDSFGVLSGRVVAVDYGS
jgi:hypothetical protein